MKKKGFIVIAIAAVLILVVLAVVLGKGKDTEVSNESPTAIPTIVPEDESTDVTEVPEPTQEVVVTEIPEPTQEVVVTEIPEPTQEVVVTEIPEPTQEVVATEIPEPTQEVVVTEIPEPTQEVVVTEIPEPTQEVVVTEIPTPTKGVEDDVIPTAPIIKDDEDDKNDTTIKDDVPNFDDGQEATPTPSVSEAPSPTPIVEVTKVPTPTPKVEVTPTLVPTLAPTSTPTPTPKPQVTKAPSSGEGITLESIDVDIPLRDSFNKEGLVDSKDSTWYGKVGDKEKGMELTNMLVEVQDALREEKLLANASQGFQYLDNSITFDYLMKGSNSHLELHRDTQNGEYILEINTPLDYFEHRLYGNGDISQGTRDVLKVMLSIILDSKDVDKVFDMIYEDIYGEVCISDSGWTTIGNCKVHYNDPESVKGHYVYHIKAN